MNRAKNLRKLNKKTNYSSSGWSYWTKDAIIQAEGFTLILEELHDLHLAIKKVSDYLEIIIDKLGSNGVGAVTISDDFEVGEL